MLDYEVLGNTVHTWFIALGIALGVWFILLIVRRVAMRVIGRIPEILKAAVEAQPKTRFDRSHFTKFGPYSLDFETIYYVEVPDMTEYLNIQQAINLRVFTEFADQGIEFAYPTQTIHGIPAVS